MNKFRVAQIVCKYLPPIFSQYVRNMIITIKDGELLGITFNRKSITGSNFIGNTNDFHALKFGVHGYFDWRNIVLVNKILKLKRGNIVEVGANIGTETVSFADIAKKQKVELIAFEPVPENCDSLFVLIEENRYNNVRIMNKIVADRQGFSSFKIPKGNDSGSGYICSIEEESETKEFEVTTLDIELVDVKNFAVIVVDVEGFEYQVLSGAINIIKRDRPYLIIEVNRNYLENRGKITLEKLNLFLTNLDYIPFYIDKFGIHEVDILNFIVKSNKNWICIPKDKISTKSRLSNSIFFNAINPFIEYKIF